MKRARKPLAAPPAPVRPGKVVPSLPASAIEYRCTLDGFRGTYDQRDEHRASADHQRAEGKRR